MYNQTKIAIFTTTLFLVFSGFLAFVTATEPITLKSHERILISGLSVTKTSATSVGLAWSGWSGAGDYTVSVLNLTTSQLEQQFTSSNASTSVSNLTVGHTYRFSVEKAGYVITEDILM